MVCFTVSVIIKLLINSGLTKIYLKQYLTSKVRAKLLKLFIGLPFLKYFILIGLKLHFDKEVVIGRFPY